ncbi:MAG TPA: PfkB family carbohydrate kinase [Gaiellaceae bacterium]|nr:PfkB family carbohydrate kinase [Gaiellaceae bacterium]
MVGHVEWVEFARVARWPEAGAIIHATEVWSEPAGGGAVVARQLALLAGRCELFTAFGDDEAGRAAVRRLAELGVDTHVRRQHGSHTRRAWTHIDGEGERTITVLGAKLLPFGPLPLEGYDLVFFVSGDAEALRSARRARFVAATMREQPLLHEAGVHIDLMSGSANDSREHYDGTLDVGLVVLTDGPNGGTANGERFAAVAPPGPVVDTYGAGDSFSAALAFALARGDTVPDALKLAARAGAAVLTGRGPYTAQLPLSSA